MPTTIALVEQLPNEKKPKEERRLGVQIAKQLAALAFGCLFLWLAFRGRDLEQIWGYAKRADLFFLFLVALSCVISHLLRAWRWLILLRPLTDRKISLWNSFCAVIIGYAVNIVIPRGGEVARLVSISKSENLPWAGVLSTMLIDRLLDLAALCLIFGSALPILPKSLLVKMPFLTGGGILMMVSSVALLLFLPFMSGTLNYFLALPSVKKLLPEKMTTKLAAWLSNFRSALSP